MKSKDRFYVYGIYESCDKQLLDNCLYIGKGTGFRLNKSLRGSKSERNPYKRRKINKLKENNIEVYSKKIVKNLGEEKAYEIEKFLIREIGLNNLTNLKIENRGFPSGSENPMYGKTGSKHPGSKDKNTVKGENHPWYEVTGNEHPASSTPTKKQKEKQLQNIPKGEDHKRSKLTKREAKEIKWLAINTNINQESISSKYPIKRPTVSAIKNERLWKNVKPTKPKYYNDS